MKKIYYLIPIIMIVLLVIGLVLPVEGADTGAVSPGTTVDDSSTSGVTWANVNNSQTSDDTYTTATFSASQTSHYIKATNFGFSIPVGATIDGVVVEVEKKETHGTQNIFDNAVRIVKGGTIGTTDKSSVTEWSTTEGYTSYGSSSDLWGETLTSDDVNASTFGTAFSAKTTSVDTVAYVDHIRITVYYTEAPAGQTASQTRIR